MVADECRQKLHNVPIGDDAEAFLATVRLMFKIIDAR